MIRTALTRTLPTEPKVRVKKCRAKACRKQFQPRNGLQTCCSASCAIDHAIAERVRKERSERQEGLRKLKTRRDHLKDAQTAFNAWVRARDADHPCISCGRHHQGQWHAGHFRSVGAQPALRFNELNVHKQCAPCNNHKSGNVVEYRLRLLQKIGREAVELLEVEHAPARWTVEELQAIKALYRLKLKQLKGVA